jgi:phosphatidylethanolamine/phosphatidyl-N-methylethanolamine N-methyltransferase
VPEHNRSLRLQPDDRFAFFRGFLKRPKQVGSIIPSSRFLERRVTRATRAHRAKLIVELGPGTGGTTRALLRAMQPEARLLAIEINPHFVEVLQRWPDKRLIVVPGSALDIGAILAARGLSAPDVIVSGIPFSTMTMPIGRDILRSVYDALEPGGAFVAYQVRDRVNLLGREVFGRARVQTELLNVPPMRIYRWEKHVTSTPRPLSVQSSVPDRNSVATLK